MAKIVIGWEYGSGFGHVAMLVPLAETLRNAGHEVVLILKDLVTTRHLWEPSGIKVAQAPFIRMPESWDKSFPTETLADIFMLAGLTDAEKLCWLAKSWQKALAEQKPDIVIAEFGPTLALAALDVYPLITVGTGYSVPPAGRTFPPIRFWNQQLSLGSILHEMRLYDAVCAARKSIGLTPPAFTADLFGGQGVFVCTLPELDCYKACREEAAIGPLTEVKLSEAALQTDRGLTEEEEYRIFFYLAWDGDTKKILEGIKAAGFPADGYIRGITPEQRQQCAGGNLHIYDTPQSLPEILPKRSLLIHHGGMSTADIAVRIGVPQLVISRHLEQRVTGALLQQSGVGIVLMQSICKQPAFITERLQSMIKDRAIFAQKAKNLAGAVQRPGKPAVEIVTESCNQLLSAV